MRLSYPAIISASDGAYSATIPDFEEIAVYAQSVDGIMIELDAALHEAVTIRTMRGEVLPVASAFEQSLAYSEDEVTWWTIAHCDAPNENFRRIMSGLHEIEMALTQQPVLVVGLEMSPKGSDDLDDLMADTALSQESLDALIDKHRDELLANPPTKKFWLDEAALGLIPGKW